MGRFFAHFWRVAPCLLAIIVDYMGYGLVYPLVASMFTEANINVFPHLGSIHLRNFYMGLAYLLYPLGMFFGASFLGDLSDLWGRKKVILLSVGGIAASFIVMASSILAHSVIWFLIGRLASGMMAGSQPLSQAAVADISTKETKPWNMALVSLTNCVGLVFGPLIAGIFSERWFIYDLGYSFPFYVAAFFALVTFFWIFFRFEETFKKKNRAAKKIDWTRPVRIFIEAFENKKVRLLALVLLLFQLAVALYYQNSAIYLSREFHFSSSAIGYFYGYLGLCFVAATLWAYPFALKHLSPINVSLLGLFVLGIFEVVLPFLPQIFVFFCIIFIMAVFNILAWTPLLTIFSNCVDETKQGWVMGIFSSTVAIGFILSGFSTNLLTLLGSQWIIFIGGILSIASGFFLLLYKKLHPSI